MTPPIWLDEARPAVPELSLSGRETPLFRVHGRHLWSRPGWEPFQVEHAPSWCGHPSVTVLLPEGGGWWRPVPVWDPKESLEPVEVS